MTTTHPKSRPAFWIPLAVIVIGSVLFRITGLDLQLARNCWNDGWIFTDNPFFDFLYKFGTWPAMFIAVGSLLLMLYSYAAKRIQQYRPAMLYLVLVMVIGPGIFVNAIFKDHFGRPRPAQLVEFGGELEYLPIFTPGIAGQGKSFPSGHASMGFYLSALYFVYFYRNRRRAYIWLGIGLGFGALMGVTRIVQGGHFISDVFWSGAFVYLTAWGLYALLSRRYGLKLERQDPFEAQTQSTEERL